MTVDVMTMSLGGAAFLQLVLMVQLWRTSRAAGRGDRRIEQLTSALELLTDTTESGFVNVAAELTRVGARPITPTSTRRATSERIAAAIDEGRPIAEVAAAEGLSETEVRLHLGLHEAAPHRRVTAPDPRAAEADVLDDLERWMSTLSGTQRVPSGGVRHAALRG
jgi:hypothetical protein